MYIRPRSGYTPAQLDSIFRKGKEEKKKAPGNSEVPDQMRRWREASR